MEQEIASATGLAAFYLDEDLAERMGADLRAAGFDAVTTREVGHRRFLDAKQLAFASTSHRVLVTANFHDFRLLHEAWHIWHADFGFRLVTAHAGIVVVPDPSILPGAEAALLIAAFARTVPITSIRDRFWRWRASTGWVDLSAVY